MSYTTISRRLLLENRDPGLESEFVGVQNVRWCLRVATRRTFLGGDVLKDTPLIQCC